MIKVSGHPRRHDWRLLVISASGPVCGISSISVFFNDTCFIICVCTRQLWRLFCVCEQAADWRLRLEATHSLCLSVYVLIMPGWLYIILLITRILNKYMDINYWFDISLLKNEKKKKETPVISKATDKDKIMEGQLQN